MKSEIVTIHKKAAEQLFLDVLDVFYAISGSNFWLCGWNPKVWPFKWKLLNSTGSSFVQRGHNFFWVCMKF